MLPILEALSFGIKIHSVLLFTLVLTLVKQMRTVGKSGKSVGKNTEVWRVRIFCFSNLLEDARVSGDCECSREKENDNNAEKRERWRDAWPVI